MPGPLARPSDRQLLPRGKSSMPKAVLLHGVFGRGATAHRVSGWETAVASSAPPVPLRHPGARIQPLHSQADHPAAPAPLDSAGSGWRRPAMTASLARGLLIQPDRMRRSLFQRSRPEIGRAWSKPQWLQSLNAEFVKKSPRRSALNRAIPRDIRLYFRPRKPLLLFSSLLLWVAAARGCAGRNICPSVQPHDWLLRAISVAGVWRAFHQATDRLIR